MSKFILFLPHKDLLKSASLLVFVTFGNMWRSFTIIHINLFQIQAPHLLCSLPANEAVPIHSGTTYLSSGLFRCKTEIYG